MSEGSGESSDPKPLKTTIEGEVFLHKDIWAVVQRQLAHAERMPGGSFYDNLVAMVFMSHALEGYLNFVGERLDAEFRKKERRMGFAVKAAKVFELCGLPEPDRAARPYSSVWLLKNLRDDIAHAKPFKFKIDREHGHDDVPDFTGPNHHPLIEIVSHTNAQQCADDVREVVRMIHPAAAKLRIDDLYFGDEGLAGNMSHRTYFTRGRNQPD
jgi:hypothetical protein